MQKQAGHSLQQSIIEYIIITVLVAAVVGVALVTLGESKEDYVEEASTDHEEELETNDAP